MRQTFTRFFSTYFLFVALFILQKPFFMVYYHKLFSDTRFTDHLAVMWHGLPLDFSVAGYLTIVPGMLLIASLWMHSHLVRPLLKGYFLVVSLLLSVIFVTDIVLYEHWGFRLDSTPFFYFFSSPKDAFASAGYLSVVLGFLAAGVIAWLFYFPFNKWVICPRKECRVACDRGKQSLLLLLFIALLFIPIRGGFTVSTMNISKAYYSDNMYLNHATVNPFFSLMESLTREKDFAKQYRFFSPEQADERFAQLVEPAQAADAPVAEIPQLLTTDRPNLFFVILESFFAGSMTHLEGIPEVAPRLDQLAEEGVLFTNFYANSFRTDRGLVSLLSGYPAQPTTSIMKYPKKTQSLPSIPRSLKENGYSTHYYYGGDADFTNMRAYLLSMGITQIVSDADFPLSERLSKWGAHDHVVFNRVIDDMKKQSQEPFLKIIQTSSSHEPFKVPYEKLEEPFLNSVAYTDSCLGDFIDRLRELEQWDNSLFVLVADHGERYPRELPNYATDRFHIPLILAGGAVKEAMRIETYASQMDLAATLLHQLNITHESFTFSKNILNPESPHFAYFSYPNAFGILTEENQVVFDCDSERILAEQGEDSIGNISTGKALLQKLYDDLAKR